MKTRNEMAVDWREKKGAVEADCVAIFINTMGDYAKDQDDLALRVPDVLGCMST
jgi:hypothetical protein